MMVSLSAIQMVLASFGVIVGALSVLVLRKLQHSSDAAMARLHLMPEKTIKDFQIFTVGNAIMFTGYMVYLAGTVLDVPTFYTIARYIGMIYGVFVTAVFFRWWRRL